MKQNLQLLHSVTVNMERLYVTTLLLTLAKFSGAQLQSSVERSCPGGSVTFTCTISSLAHRWEASALDMPRSVTPRDQGGIVSDPPFKFNVTEVVIGSYITSTATVSATTDLNGTLITCQDGIGMLPDQSNTISVRGPPSVPTLSCVELSGDVSGTVNVTVSWTLSGGDSADFYLISITTNAPLTPYGGLLNITTASVTLTGFMAGYQYSITVRGVNCGSQEGRESDPLTIRPQVPTTPDNFMVCPVYDKVNGTLQITETTWNELNPVTISENCDNGQDMRASYELSYTSDSGTLNTTCVIDWTECSNGTCRHVLQNNTADSRCQPPVSQLSGESVTVSLTARNIVGESNTSESRGLNGTNVNILEVRIDSTDPSNAFVECAFTESVYNCTIQYGTGPFYTNLTNEDTSPVLGRMVTITLSQQLEQNTNYYYTVSAKSSSHCVRVQGRFRTECTVKDLRLGGSEIVVRGGTVDQRCIDRGFASNISIAGGIVCYSQTMARSRAVYVCDNNTQTNDVTRVCQRDGNWNGTIPSCPVSRRLDRWHISLIVIGAVALVLSMLHINLPCYNVKWWQILLIGIATTLWVIVVALWIAVSVVMSNPPNENLRDPIWRLHRDALITSACIASVLAITCTAVVVGVHVYHKRCKEGVSHVTPAQKNPQDQVRWLRILLSSISTFLWAIGVIFWCAVGFVVSNPPNGDTRDPVWQLRRNALSYSALAASILAVICTASIVWICVYHKKSQKCWKILLLVISTISWLIGVALWCAVGVVVVSPPDGNVRDTDWQCFRNGLVISAFIVSIVAFICAAVVVWHRVYCNRSKIKKGWQIALLVIAGILTVTGVGLGIAVGVVVYSVDDENKNKESKKMEELPEVKDGDGVGPAVNELSEPSGRKEVQLELHYADLGSHIPTQAIMPPATDSNVQYSFPLHDSHKNPAGTPSASLDMTTLPQSPVDTEDSPPPPLPPKQSSAADTLQSPKLPEGREPHQSEMDAPYPPSTKANQGDSTLQSHPPKTPQQTAESKPEEQ